MSLMTEHVVRSSAPFRRWWPFLAGGLCGPLLGEVLGGWLPLYLAVGFATSVAWLIALRLFNRTSPSPAWSTLRWFGASIGAGALAGALAFLFPWK